MRNAEIKMTKKSGYLYSVIGIEIISIMPGVQTMYGTGYKTCRGESQHFQSEFIFSNTDSTLYIMNTDTRKWLETKAAPERDVEEFGHLGTMILLPDEMVDEWAIDGLIIKTDEAQTIGYR